MVKKVVREPSKTYLLNPDGDLEEHEPGKPIIIKMQPPSSNSNLPPMMPFPVMGGDGQPVYDNDGKPVYANLEPMLKWLGFQGDERRADERQKAQTQLFQTIRENIPDGIQAILKTVAEVKGGTGAKPPAPAAQEQPPVFKCGDCGTEFSPPAGWTEEPLKCPKCGREYSKSELEGV
ncbi:hypothetical protein ES703_62592 [subsurface metagenome]